MRRSLFLAAGAAAVLLARRAEATGGLDAGDLGGRPASADAVRILLARGVAQADVPIRIDDQTWTFHGHAYRGMFSLLQGTTSAFSVINVIAFEEYLYGVVGSEIPTSWPLAALEAQAIVARTFAGGKRINGRAYDLVCSEIDQAYNGRDSENAVSIAAVQATSGTYVTFGDRAAQVFFMACCGGHTMDAGEVWGGATLPYLRGVSDPHCTAAPDYRWERVVPLATLQAALGGRSAALGDLADVRISITDPAGRAQRIILVGGQGTLELTPSDLRSTLGAQYIRSSMLRSLEVSGEGTRVLRIEGEGRGHGVGMCQWGARQMALDGASARDILAFYFPGTALGAHG